MRRRHPPIPRLWLMTDERMGEALWTALERLPRGSGVVFRHHATPAGERVALLRNITKLAQRRGLVLVASRGRGANVHNVRRTRPGGLQTAAAHNRAEAIRAIRGGADALFVSPVFATRSHAGARPLGRVRFGLLVRGLGVPVIALGGMTQKRARSLGSFGIHGWAAIDAWL